MASYAVHDSGAATAVRNWYFKSSSLRYALGFWQHSIAQHGGSNMTASYGNQLRDAIREFLPSSFFPSGR
jgi:hypothetical protein